MVAIAMLVNKHMDSTFYLPDTDETYHVDDDDIQFLGAIVKNGPSMKILTRQE